MAQIRVMYCIGLLCILLTSCKTAKVATDGIANEKLTVKNIIRRHYQNEAQFKTVSGKLKIAFSDGENSQSVPLTVRIEKDKVIWISAPLGVVKAYITPGRVSFYNKLQNEYFDGDFGYQGIDNPIKVW